MSHHDTTKAMGLCTTRDRTSLLAWLFGSAILLINLIVVALFVLAPVLRIPVPAGTMEPDSGYNYIAGIKVSAPFPYIFAFDTAGDPLRADATVLENGHPLGPSHAMHQDIRSDGAGRVSFWSGAVYFSTSDHSDPRTNGRSYEARVQLELPRRVTWGLLACDLVAALILRRAVLRLATRYGEALIGICVLAFTARIAAAAAGWLPSLFTSSASTIDTGMAWQIVLHVMLGFALTALIFATGVGSLLWFDQRRNLDDLLLRAFLPGTIVAAAAALMAVSLPGGLLPAALACMVAMLPLLWFRAEAGALRRAAYTPLLAAPVIALFAAVLCFRFHGPSATIAGLPLGDDTIYVGWANMLAQHVAPVFNFGVEGDRTPYGNLLPSLFTAPFISFAWFDPYLFLCASLPALALLSLSATLPLMRAAPEAGVGSARTGLDWLLLGGLLASSFRFPSTIPESPPFVFLVPIVVSVCYMVRAEGGIEPRPWQAMLTSVVGTAISKVVAFIVLVPLALPEIAGHVFRIASRRQRIAAAVAAACVLGYVAVTLRTYLAVNLAVADLGPLSWGEIIRDHSQSLLRIACTLGRDVGAVVLAASVVRSSRWGFKLGVWLGVAATLTLPYLFHTSLTAAILLVAVVAWTSPRGGDFSRPVALAAAMLLFPYTVVMDWGGISVTSAWCAFVATLLWLLARSRNGRSGAVPSRRWPAAIPGMVLVFCAVCLWGAGVGALAVGQQDLTFTPELRDIWLAVKRDTPRDALVFTDQTNGAVDRLRGWNDFALASQRQFYVVAWDMSPLRTDLIQRRAMLDRNDAVLSGALSPTSLALSRPYGGYFAVLAKGHTPPPGSSMIYTNGSYTLWKLSGRQPAGD